MYSTSMFDEKSTRYAEKKKQNIVQNDYKQSQYSPGRVQRNLLSDNKSQGMFEKQEVASDNKSQGQQSFFGALRDAYYNLSYKAKGITHSHLTKTL